MLWQRCMVRGAWTGLLVGLLGGGILAWLLGPSLGLVGRTLCLTALTTAAGAVTGLTTLMWLRGSAQVGSKLSGMRAGAVSGLIVGGLVGGGAAGLFGLTGGALGAALSAASAAAATAALTAAAGAPLGCTVKGWLERE